MRVEHGLRAAALGVALAVAAGCGVAARLTRPEGDGGWSPADREEECATLATALYQAHTRAAELRRLMGLPVDRAAYEGP